MKARTPALAVLACALFVAGCGQNETTPTATTASPAPTSASVTSTPSETASPQASTPTQAATPEEPTQDSPAAAAPTTPAPRATTRSSAALAQRDTGEYGDALMAAWAAGNSSAVEQYASPSAAAALMAEKPGADLLRTACESNMCSYADEAGRRVTLTFDESKVGQGVQKAVTEVKIDS